MEGTYQADFAGAGLLFYLFQADADPDHKDCGRRRMRLTDRDLPPLTRRSSRQAPISSKVTTPSVDGEHDLRAILEGYLGADGYTTPTADIEAAALALVTELSVALVLPEFWRTGSLCQGQSTSSP